MYDGGATDTAEGIAVDTSGHIYVTGSKHNGTDNDCFIIKYDSDGTIIWTNQYDGGSNDASNEVVVYNSDYVYITGEKENGTNKDYLTIKYDANNGNAIWTQQYNGGSNDVAMGIAVDNSGFVYVTGIKHNGTDSDYFTIKYDSSGNTIWTQQYDGGNGDDKARDIVTDTSGFAYVTGIKHNGTDSDYFTIKHDTMNGNIVWTQQYDGGIGDDKAYGIAVDNSGFVYVTGNKDDGFDSDFLTIKYLQPDSSEETNQESQIKISDDFAVYPNYIDLSKEEKAKIVMGKSCEIEIRIYNAMGILVKTYTKRYYNEGDYIEWDGMIGNTGKKVGAGIYIVFIKGDNIDKKLKMIVKK